MARAAFIENICMRRETKIPADRQGFEQGGVLWHELRIRPGHGRRNGTSTLESALLPALVEIGTPVLLRICATTPIISSCHSPQQTKNLAMILAPGRNVRTSFAMMANPTGRRFFAAKIAASRSALRT